MKLLFFRTKARNSDWIRAILAKWPEFWFWPDFLGQSVALHQHLPMHQVFLSCYDIIFEQWKTKLALWKKSGCFSTRLSYGGASKYAFYGIFERSEPKKISKKFSFRFFSYLVKVKNFICCNFGAPCLEDKLPNWSSKYQDLKIWFLKDKLVKWRILWTK